MLDILVQAIIGLFRDRLVDKTSARARASRAIVRLYTSLETCHESYLRWKRVNGTTRDGPEYEQWKTDLSALSAEFSAIREKLDAYAPRVSRHIAAYESSEYIHADKLSGPEQDDAIFAIMSIGSADDPELLDDFESFDKAAQVLRDFIRSEYKWDDLFL
ncbi:MAG TPA: hypothetical protein VKB34_18005 [Povalibacter sp.]|nr:hypothetical protein [Povalibacter sp.]